MSFETTLKSGQKSRLHYLDQARRVVIKVGSAVLTQKKGMNIEVIENLVRDIAILQSSGKEIILVSSGAVAAGKQKMQQMAEKDITLPEKQALAAIGQSQ